MVLVLIALDSASILCAFLVAVYESLPWDVTFVQGSIRHLPYLAIFAPFWFGAAVDLELFRHWRIDRFPSFLFAVTKALGSALVVSTVIMALSTRAGVDRQFLLAFCAATAIVILVLRAVAQAILFALESGGLLPRHIVVVGANERTIRLVNTLRRQPGCVVDGILDDDMGRAQDLELEGIAYLGRTDTLEPLIEARRPHEVYVCLPMQSSYEQIQEITRLCAQARVEVRVVADLFPLQVANNRLMYIEDIPLLSLSTIPETRVRLAFKRLVDLAVSTLLLIPLLPVFALIGILIKLESKGPVFFPQERVGQNQRRFNMLKFRSMVADAEELRAELEALNEADGPVFKIRDDPRITRLGRFIRKYSVDELPQLINVWVGEMSLVGPRPPLASEVEQYSWSQRRRLSIRPGMTGLWQVSGRSDVGFEEWVELDLEYIDTWSLGHDFLILLKTFRAVIEGRGAA